MFVQILLININAILLHLQGKISNVFDKNVKKWPHIIAEIVFKHVVQQDKCTNYKTLGG